MNSMEFGMVCRPYNIKYRDLFGYIPVPDNYACNRDEFFDALVKAVESEKRIEEYVKLRAKNTDNTKLY